MPLQRRPAAPRVRLYEMAEVWRTWLLDDEALLRPRTEADILSRLVVQLLGSSKQVVSTRELNMVIVSGLGRPMMVAFLQYY